MNKIILPLTLVMVLFAGCTNTQVAEIPCDVRNPCPEGLECWVVESSLPQCVEPDPCNWRCGGKCAIQESYPPRVLCSR